MAKPVRPQVADKECEDEREELMERGSFNAVAVEKVSSPTTVRKKQVKTMSRLLENTPF